MKQIKASKNVKPKVSKGTNVRLTESNYGLIKEFCKKRGYKIGAYVENAALKSIFEEAHPLTNK